MKWGQVFLGKPVHWLLWAVIVAVLYWLGSESLHVRHFVPFLMVLIVLAGGSVLVVLSTYRKDDRITREPFDEG
ncbi:MAG: hypothetical protein QNJ30_05710 [Kiloniellales bacterium]|nr:hypothetical protein [Kiloniellales bacterium]